MPSIKHIAFHAYPVRDITRARAFYENVLGLKITHNFKNAWIEYDIGSGTLAISTMDGNLKPGVGGMIALEVDDLDAWIAELQAKKVPLLTKVIETPICRMVDIADPDANGITLHQCKPGHR